MKDYSLRPMTESDLEQVLQWRNHPEVRRYMYTTHEIRLEEHRKWFMNATTNPAIELLIYEQGGKAQGFVNITRTRCPEVADWGFYL
jgi:RimJ/RimL family protein N-acetyltransferase